MLPSLTARASRQIGLEGHRQVSPCRQQHADPGTVCDLLFNPEHGAKPVLICQQCHRQTSRKTQMRDRAKCLRRGTLCVCCASIEQTAHTAGGVGSSIEYRPSTDARMDGRWKGGPRRPLSLTPCSSAFPPRNNGDPRRRDLVNERSTFEDRQSTNPPLSSPAHRQGNMEMDAMRNTLASPMAPRSSPRRAQVY